MWLTKSIYFASQRHMGFSVLYFYGLTSNADYSLRLGLLRWRFLLKEQADLLFYPKVLVIQFLGIHLNECLNMEKNLLAFRTSEYFTRVFSCFLYIVACWYMIVVYMIIFFIIYTLPFLLLYVLFPICSLF